MIVHRYILKQIVKPLTAVFFALNCLLLVVQLLKVGESTFAVGLAFTDLWRAMIFFLPGFIVITGPVTVLLGVLLGFAHMSEDGELVALAACGLSPLKLATVPAAIGLAAWGLSFYLASFIAPVCSNLLKGDFANLAKRQVVASLRAGEFFEDIPRLVFYPAKATSEPGVFNGFLLFDHRRGRVRHALLASRAKVLADLHANRLALSLSDGQVHVRDRASGQYSVLDFRSAEVRIDIERVVRDRTRFLHPYETMTMKQLFFAASEDGQLPKSDRLRAASVLHRRFSFPASCLVFALLATTLGLSGRLRTRRSTLLVTAAIVVAYYLTVRSLDAFVQMGTMTPAIAAWAPNFLMFALVGWLMARRGRVL